jgi:hypothetical protein
MSSVAYVPQWSRDIKSIRSRLKLSQSELGKRLNCSAMAYYLAIAKIAGPFFGWTFWNLAGIRKDDVQRMPVPKARTKKQQHSLSNAIIILEVEVARSGARAARRDALFPDLPTLELRREYKTIAIAEANFARVVAYHIQVLKSFGV